VKRLTRYKIETNTRQKEKFLQKAVVRQLVLLSHEGRSWTKDPTHPRPFMNV
jgi:hypothetical protein